MELAEAMALTKNGNNCQWDNPFMYLIWLAFFGGGNGFGWGNRGEYATAEQVRQVNDTQTLLAKADTLGMGINGVNTSILQTGANLQNAMFQGNANLGDKVVNGFNNLGMAAVNGFNSVNAGIAESRFAAQQCCCETNRNIDAVKYSQLQGDSAIMANDTANTQKVLDAICALKSDAKDAQIAQLRSDLQAAQLTLGNANQTANIVNALRPTPIPAYITTSPYATYGGCGCANV